MEDCFFSFLSCSRGFFFQNRRWKKTLFSNPEPEEPSLKLFNFLFEDDEKLHLSYHNKKTSSQDVGEKDERDGERHPQPGAHAEKVLASKVETVTLIPVDSQQDDGDENGLKN